MFDRYIEARARGDQRVAVALEERPFSCLTGFMLGMSVIAASIYLAVFTDSKEEFSRHLWQSGVGIAVLAVLFTWIFRLEKRSPLPLRLRRFLWQAMVIGYLVLAGCLLCSLFLPYARMQLFRMILSLGAILPLPVTAWQLLQKTKHG